jgi:hypothetical protein
MVVGGSIFIVVDLLAYPFLELHQHVKNKKRERRTLSISKKEDIIDA